MSWSEEAFRTRCRRRADELGKPVRKLMIEGGLGHDTLDKEPAAGRRIDTLGKIGAALKWSLAEVMGFSVLGRISIELSKTAFSTADQVLNALPASARTQDTLIYLHARIYDLLAARERDGQPITEEILTAYQEMLVATWNHRTPPPGGQP